MISSDCKINTIRPVHCLEAVKREKLKDFRIFVGFALKNFRIFVGFQQKSFKKSQKGANDIIMKRSWR